MGQRLGQHFLTRSETAVWVADAIDITEEDVVLEIGPGHGILTREILKKAKRVVAVEKDASLVAELQNTFSEEIASGTLILIEEDVRDFTPETCSYLKNGYVLSANIPYYITGYIIRKFLTTPHQPKHIAILIQKEVAERIVARDNKHSILSVSVWVYGTPTLVRTVKAGAFSPPPKVDSAILSIQNISKHFFEGQGVDEVHFFTLLKTAFSQKRKTLGKTIGSSVGEKVFSQCSLDKKTRPEDVSLETWLCLARN